MHARLRRHAVAVHATTLLTRLKRARNSKPKCVFGKVPRIFGGLADIWSAARDVQQVGKKEGEGDDRKKECAREKEGERRVKEGRRVKDGVTKSSESVGRKV